MIMRNENNRTQMKTFDLVYSKRSTQSCTIISIIYSHVI